MNRENYYVKKIPLNLIDANPFQPRKTFDDDGILELAESIKEMGLLQPISVREKEDDRYELIAGERRLRACEIAGVLSVPSLIVEISDAESAVLALVENLQRENLNFIEEAEGYRALIDDHGFSQRDISEKIGKSQSAISNKLRILKLSPYIKDVIVENQLSERHARALLNIEDEEDRIKILKQIIKNDLNVKKTEEIINNYLEMSKKKSRGNQKIFSKINYKIYINTLKEAYQTIINTGFMAEYKEEDKGNYIEVVVKIPKE